MHVTMGLFIVSVIIPQGFCCYVIYVMRKLCEGVSIFDGCKERNIRSILSMLVLWSPLFKAELLLHQISEPSVPGRLCRTTHSGFNYPGTCRKVAYYVV